jgi:aspartate/methionine/tyrosine aminotransferase
MRQAIQNLQESRIREVANAGMGRSDVLAFWFGESDEVTPGIHPARPPSTPCRSGETFYAHNLGLPRAAVHAIRQLHVGAARADRQSERIAVTSGGVSALMLAVQALVDAGDEVVAVTPVWPNLVAQPADHGGHGALRLAQAGGLAPGPSICPTLLAAITPRTRLLVVNAPNNPTGWTLTRDEQVQILAALPGRPAHGSWPTRCTSACISNEAEWPVPRVSWMSRRTGRPAGGGAQFFQELS